MVLIVPVLVSVCPSRNRSGSRWPGNSMIPVGYGVSRGVISVHGAGSKLKCNPDCWSAAQGESSRKEGMAQALFALPFCGVLLNQRSLELLCYSGTNPKRLHPEGIRPCKVKPAPREAIPKFSTAPL